MRKTLPLCCESEWVSERERENVIYRTSATGRLCLTSLNCSFLNYSLLFLIPLIKHSSGPRSMTLFIPPTSFPSASFPFYPRSPLIQAQQQLPHPSSPPLLLLLLLFFLLPFSRLFPSFARNWSIPPTPTTAYLYYATASTTTATTTTVTTTTTTTTTTTMTTRGTSMQNARHLIQFSSAPRYFAR